MSKDVIVLLKDGESFLTKQTKVTYLSWGIRFVTDDERSIMYVPWNSIENVKEVIS